MKLTRLKKNYRKAVVVATITALGILSIGGACFAGTENLTLIKAGEKKVVAANGEFSKTVNANKGMHRIVIHNEEVKNPGGYLAVEGARVTSKGYDEDNTNYVLLKITKAGIYSSFTWNYKSKAGDYKYCLTPKRSCTTDMGYPSCKRIVLNYGNVQVQY